VKCGAKRRRVVSLSLPSQGLTGVLSPAVGNLSSLRLLNLSSNWFITGGIPASHGCLHRLQALDLSNNAFSAAAEEAIYEVVAEPQEPQGQAPQQEDRGELAQGPAHPSSEQQTQGPQDVDFCPCCVKFIRRDAEGWQVIERDP